MFSEHPVITWAGIIFGFLFGVGAVVGVVWNFYSTSQQSEEIIALLRDLREVQGEMRTQAATQAVQLDTIGDRQDQIQTRQRQIQDRQGEIESGQESGQQWLASELNARFSTIAVEVGRLSGSCEAHPSSRERHDAN